MSTVNLLRRALYSIGLPEEEVDWQIVQLLMKAKGLPMYEVAVQLGTGPSSLSQTKHRRQPRFEQGLAAVLGVKVEELWPSRYGERRQPVDLSSDEQEGQA